MNINDITIKDLEILADKVDSQESKSLEPTKRVIDAGEYIFFLLKDYGPLSSRKTTQRFSVIEINDKIRADIRNWIDDKTASTGVTLSGKELKLILDNSATIQRKWRSKKVTKAVTIANKRVAFFDEPVVISSRKYPDGLWNLEVNIIDWGSGKTFDIRIWNESHTRAKKGFVFGLDAWDTLMGHMRRANNEFFEGNM